MLRIQNNIATNFMFTQEQMNHETLEQKPYAPSSENEVRIPSAKTSQALAKAATENPEAIEKQASEAIQYIRQTAILVDQKIAKANETIHKCIDQALNRMSEARGRLQELLEQSKGFSSTAKEKAISAVNECAQVIIDSINSADEGSVLSLDVTDLDVLDETEESIQEPHLELVAKKSLSQDVE